MYLTALVVDLAGRTLLSATGISSDGNTIVGSGRNSSGIVEPWIAVIPEPSSVLLIGLGLVGLSRMRNR